MLVPLSLSEDILRGEFNRGLVRERNIAFYAQAAGGCEVGGLSVLIIHQIQLDNYFTSPNPLVEVDGPYE